MKSREQPESRTIVNNSKKRPRVLGVRDSFISGEPVRPAGQARHLTCFLIKCSLGLYEKADWPCRLAVDLTSSLSFFCSPSSKTRDTQMAARVTDRSLGLPRSR